MFRIDLFKVYAAILQGVQNYWGERAAKRKMQIKLNLPLSGLWMVDSPFVIDFFFYFMMDFYILLADK